VALVVLLRGVNVGGHRTFRPATLASELKHLGAVNIGAAGTFVIRAPASQGQVREEFARRLPFDSQIVICQGREIVRLLASDVFANDDVQAGIVRFVSVMSETPRLTPATPIIIPSTGDWLVKILARERRFIIGQYRRHMKVISYLGTLDRLFGVPVTTRNWNTLGAIAKVLDRK
jgi:uncharacterized protein (DUF1697 family)